MKKILALILVLALCMGLSAVAFADEVDVDAEAAEVAEEIVADDAEEATEEVAADDAEEATEEVAADDAEEVTEEEVADDAEEVTEEEVAEDAEEVTEEEVAEDAEEVTEEEVAEEVVEEEATEEAVEVQTTAFSSITAIYVENDDANVDFVSYEIAGEMFFKLRDVAAVLAGTDYEFGVAWDAENSAIALTNSAEYVAVGGENAIIETAEKDLAANEFAITVNGEAYEAVAYNIDGNTYFTLDTLETMLGINAYCSDAGEYYIWTTMGGLGN